jgi:Flp pilus assembly pilin Flp
MNHLTRLYAKISARAGQTMAEYALIMGAIVVACVLAYNTLGTTINAAVATVNGAI